MRYEDKGTIRRGDIVQVDFNNSEVTLSNSAEVIHMPQATGDCWIFKGLDTGFLYHVSEGCTISYKLKEQSQ